MCKPDRQSNGHSLKIAVLLLLLAGCCTTQDVGRVVVAPQPKIPEPPAFLQTEPPEPTFQLKLRSFFLTSQQKRTGLPNMPGPAANGP